MNITLRIKRRYFDDILTGRKKVEYRDYKDYYKKLFKDKTGAKTLTLHYQQKRKLVCQIVDIKRLSLREARKLTPEEFTNDDVTFGRYLFAIYIKRPHLISGET